jgi:hypothetical protein
MLLWEYRSQQRIQEITKTNQNARKYLPEVIVRSFEDGLAKVLGRELAEVEARREAERKRLELEEAQKAAGNVNKGK